MRNDALGVSLRDASLGDATDASGSVDDKLNRVTELKNGTTSVVQYTNAGLASPMKTTYVQPNLSLDFTVTNALDRFGRVIDHAWKKVSGTALVQIKHGYDRVGNRLYREDIAATNAGKSFDELYAYDGMNQIKSLNRGTSTTQTFSESWNYDATGNWLQYNNNGQIENRTHNKANEIQSIVSHDRNGNMIVLPDLNCKYDAWNRLVEVRESSNILIATYRYDGRNFRLEKIVNGVSTKSYFNKSWQELESITNNETTLTMWGLRYIDDLILREKGTERLYSLADSNWNVAAIASASGTIQERVKYTAFGDVTFLSADFTDRTASNAGTTSSDFAWSRTFTGQTFDAESGLMLYRNRVYHPTLGRFLQRDPIGYESDDENLYRYVKNRGILYKDSLGFKISNELLNPEREAACKQVMEQLIADKQPPRSGQTICVDGEKYWCVFGTGASSVYPPDIYSIYIDCTIAHENAHIADDTITCPPEEDCTKPTLPNMPNPNSPEDVAKAEKSECRAYQNNVECFLQAATLRCNGRPDCIQQIYSFINVIIRIQNPKFHCKEHGMEIQIPPGPWV